ncbi:MAG TPA: glycosyltransferase family 2 protein [Phycisphaerales bacterium]|nr:glycosyltransferase family 2 protein [Phycisphaerales bacterium]
MTDPQAVPSLQSPSTPGRSTPPGHAPAATGRPSHPGQRPVLDPAGGRGGLPISVVILTYNEEGNIRDCLASCAWCDDVHVLDSGSKDKTCDIARAMGATVHFNKFKSFGDQRNWAIDNIPCKHPWHFHLDADERFTPELLEEMLTLLGEDGMSGPGARYSCFQCPSKMILMGKWLKWSGGYPSYQVRLFRHGQCRFMDFGHGQREDTTGEIGVLKTPYIHYNFSKGLLEWFYKHNDYSTREADEAMLIRSQGRPRFWQLWRGDHVSKRRAWKNLSYFMHGRAMWRFLYNYAARLGVLDGVAGFRYCAMISSYEYWTELKIKERARTWANATNRLVERMLAERPGTSSAVPAQPARAPTSNGSAPPGLSPRGPHNPMGVLNASRGRVEVLIPTLNEAAVIRDTVQNALSLGPVFVLDSLSTDGTQQIAREAGATVVEQKFLGYARQKNWGLENLPFKGEWVFILDADERITPSLREEVLRTIERPGADGYFVNRVVLFMARAIRHGGLFPSWNLRFFRRGTCRYEDRSVHEHMVCDGPTNYLREEMLHIRGESVHEWIRKHIRYADLESDEWVKLKFGQEAGASAKQLFSHTLKYRQYLRREIWPRTPLKPLLRFFYMYLLRRGVQDRLAGLHMATMMSVYEYMIELLYRDKLSRIASGTMPPPMAEKRDANGDSTAVPQLPGLAPQGA